MSRKNTKMKKIMTVQQILDEGKKEKPIPVGNNQFLKYIEPTKKEVRALETEVEKTIVLDREKFKTMYPNATDKDSEENEKTLVLKKQNAVADLSLWKGLNKADSSVTREMVDDMSSDTMTAIKMYLVQKSFGDMDEEQVGKLKNLLEVTKGLA